MGLTIARRTLDIQQMGHIKEITGDISFDSSYAGGGGESLTPQMLTLKEVLSVSFPEPPNGINLLYDRANQKLTAKRSGPLMLLEATGTFLAGAAYTLKQRPGYILGVRGTAGSTGAKRIIPVGETLAAGQCTVNWTTGVITWGDAAITAATIVYVPLGTPGFTDDLLVVDEAATIASNVITLTNQAAAIQYIWNDEDNEILDLVPVGEAPSGAQCAVDIDDGAGATKITVTTGRIGDGSTGKTKVTYLKRANNPLRFIDQADRTVTSNIVGPGTDQTFDVAGLVLPGYGQVIVGETSGAANLQSLMIDPDGSVAANVSVYNPYRNSISFASGDAYATVEIPLLYLDPALAGMEMAEIPNGADLSALTAVRFVARGR